MATIILDQDIVAVRDAADPSKRLATLFWGDELETDGEQGNNHVVLLPRRVWNDTTKHYDDVLARGLIAKSVKLRNQRLLKIRFVDVGQGDAAMIETPGGKFILVDGGEGEELRRYMFVAFAHLMKNRALPIDTMVVTHGDADHFAGLTRLAKAFRNSAHDPMITVERVLHNGLAKGPSELDDEEMFGDTATQNGRLYVTELHDDIRGLPPARLNKFFKSWQTALNGLKTAAGGVPAMHRTFYGNDAAFASLQGEDIQVKVLGPITEKVQNKDSLRFLRKPGSSSNSASHTINGHSAVLQLKFKNVKFLFGADLNEESENTLVERARQDGISLASEVLKVPHHGSADFSPSVLEAVRAVVSVVSSGDESASKEYIHPRAGLIGALGKYSRASVARPLIYVTEMVAFFERIEDAPFHNAYQKKAFGIVHIRTDGERVMVATHSGKDDMKESYAFKVAPDGSIEFES